jgi:hypothetical protein
MYITSRPGTFMLIATIGRIVYLRVNSSKEQLRTDCVPQVQEPYGTSYNGLCTSGTAALSNTIERIFCVPQVQQI